MAETPRLRDKLLVFYGLAKSIKSDAAFAEAVGRGRSTVTGWINGTDATAENTIPDSNFERIAEVFNEELGKSLSVAETKALWRGTLGSFIRRLAEPLPNAFDDVLGANAQRLPVRCLPIWHDTLGMVEGAIDVPPDAIGLSTEDRVAFEIDGHRNHGLVVLSQDRNGWTVLCPGNFHGGVIERKPERFPAHPSPIRFTAPLGLQRMVFIEVQETFVPMLPRHGGASALHHTDLIPFVEQLSEPPWRDRWRWQQAHFWVTQGQRIGGRSARDV